jgi:hypothetical protein
MSSFEEPFDEQLSDSDSVCQAEIDRMVDGELSDEQQRSLLKRLEDSPSGWKNLALAYVEAAAWKYQFSRQPAIAGSDTAGSAPVATESPIAKAASPESAATHNSTPRNQSAATSTFAVVAVLLVFGLGIWLGRTQFELPDQPNSIADRTESPSSETPHILPQEEQRTAFDGAVDRDALPVPKTVQVVYSDGQSDVLRVVNVPIADSIPGDGSQQLDEFWNRRESAIPAELRAALEQSGHQISESRDLWPAQLPDGRSVVIPVSQVHVANNPLVFP